LGGLLYGTGLATKALDNLKLQVSYKGSVFIDNSQYEIQEAIEIVKMRSKEMIMDISSLREEKTKEWKRIGTSKILSNIR
jgi:hypothetical protein